MSQSPRQHLERLTARGIESAIKAIAGHAEHAGRYDQVLGHEMRAVCQYLLRPALASVAELGRAGLLVEPPEVHRWRRKQPAVGRQKDRSRWARAHYLQTGCTRDEALAAYDREHPDTETPLTGGTDD